MNINEIIIKGAREHNLKNVNLVIPRNKLIVMTGLSGSGKSSLAFDTIYAEGQRRYVESLSSYARQFLGQMEKPDVDYIEGLSPAISIDQKTTSRNPRSTVGTVTEIHDYLRLMYARIGVPHCPKCGKPITQQTVDQIVDQILALPERTRLMILAPVVRGRKGEFVKLLEDMGKQGYVRARIDGELYELAELPKLAKTKKHTVEVVIDRLVVRPDIQQRLTDSLETAMQLAGGLVIASVDRRRGHAVLPELRLPGLRHLHRRADAPHVLLQQPLRRVPHLHGPGRADEDGPGHRHARPQPVAERGRDPGLRLEQRRAGLHGPHVPPGPGGALRLLAGHPGGGAARRDVVDMLLYGTKGEKIRISYTRGDGGGTFSAPFEGIITNLERRYRETNSDAMKALYEGYMAQVPCPDCGGRRLKREALAVTIQEKNIAQVSDLSVRDAGRCLKASSSPRRSG